MAAVFFEDLLLFNQTRFVSPNRLGVCNIKRSRRSIDELFAEYGPQYSRRAYRMDKHSFNILHGLLQRNALSPKKRTKDKNLSNDGIPSETKLSVALRFFAGGDPLDIMITRGISHSSVYKCVWQVVDAVNECDMLKITFPKNHEAQHKIARGFQDKSRANFNCRVSAIDGMLIWITKPIDCDSIQIGAGKFYCGRKKKYGLSLLLIKDP